MSGKKTFNRKRNGTEVSGWKQVSLLRKADVLAILLADIHLSLKAPIWRSVEDDWFEAQYRPLKEVRELQMKFSCPVICAGDIFDRSRGISDGWNAPPELINFAIECLPDNMYCIPGQHDLPNHQYSEIERSAYWTLVEAEKIKNIPPGSLTIIINDTIKRPLALFGFPTGYSLCKFDGIAYKNHIKVAVVHDYVWTHKSCYPNAPEEYHVTERLKHLKDFDVAVFGDNHKGFLVDGGCDYPTLFNCGTLMRRKSDEVDYKPQVGLLLRDGSVLCYYLNISKDKYLETMFEEEEIKMLSSMDDFFAELEKLGTTSLHFSKVIQEFLDKNKITEKVKKIIYEAMGD